jgi:hypothetical protein
MLVRDRIHQLALGPGQLAALLEPLDRLVNLALLQRQLREGRDRDVAVRVDLEGFLAQRLGGANVLLPLEDGERLVDEREDVSGASERRQRGARISRRRTSSGDRCEIAVKPRSPVLVQLERAVETFHRLLELLQVQQQLSASACQRATRGGAGHRLKPCAHTH